MLISERIYKYLEERKMSQQEFVKRTGISQSTVSDWRRKGTNPSADKIMIICEVLGVTPYELLEGTENGKMKEYRQPDMVWIERRSKEYQIIEHYQKMDTSARERLEKYMEMLEEEKNTCK